MMLSRPPRNPAFFRQVRVKQGAVTWPALKALAGYSCLRLYVPLGLIPSR